MTTPHTPARFRLMTPALTATGAAIAIIQIHADTEEQLDHALTTIGLSDLPRHTPSLRSFWNIDQGIALRISPTIAQLMPHGGRYIVDQIITRLSSHGFIHDQDHLADPLALYPEASDLIEACTLDIIARAASPRAIDFLFHQRDLWRTPSIPMHDPAASRTLDHLITPPTVLLLGPPNIGKSTLTNALARRAVSIVSDERGTTRDHVGVSLTLDGLAIRWIDAPGIDFETQCTVERSAMNLALEAARTADLILIAADHQSAIDPQAFAAASLTAPMLTIALRSDLGPPIFPAAVATAAAHRTGIDDLARAVREALLPDSILTADRRWRFHPSLPDPNPA